MLLNLWKRGFEVSVLPDGAFRQIEKITKAKILIPVL